MNESEITRTAHEIENDIWPADCPPWDPRREITLEKEGVESEVLGG